MVVIDRKDLNSKKKYGYWKQRAVHVINVPMMCLGVQWYSFSVTKAYGSGNHEASAKGGVLEDMYTDVVCALHSRLRTGFMYNYLHYS